jgi:hypothetical protein
MNIKRRFTIPIVLAALTAVGCNEPKPSRSSAIERATSTAPPLTSTVPSPLPKTAVEKKPELSKAEPSVEATLQTMDGLTIRRLVTAPEVEHREPVAASASFERDEERIYAFVEVSNESDEAKVMLVHFIGPDGQVSGGIELSIPPAVPRWRTWAHTKHAKKPGLWRVEIRSANGALLGALPFEVSPSR